MGELGFNAVDHTVLVFHPTEDSAFAAGDDVREHLRHFEFGARPGHFAQIKAWSARRRGGSSSPPRAATTRASRAGACSRTSSCCCTTPCARRSTASARCSGERQARWNEEERARGWHSHYDAFASGHAFGAAADLVAYDDAFDRRYLVERLSGIGIVR